MPEAHAELMEILRTLEAPLRRHAGHGVHGGGGPPLHAPDAQRQAARAGGGAVRGRRGRRRACSTREEALATIDADRLDALLHPTFDRDAEFEVLAEGVAASPGAAKGAIVFTADEAVAAARGRPRRDPRAPVHRGRRRGRLPRRARASSPREGGKASHAALVARGMGKPCVSGAVGARDRPDGRRRCA